MRSFKRWDPMRGISQEITSLVRYLMRYGFLEMSVGMRSQERDDLSRGMISKENEIYLEISYCKK